MNCQWNALLEILPLWMRGDVDRLGKGKLQELNLRLNGFPELCTQVGVLRLGNKVREEDLRFVVNAVTQYSPWRAGSAAEGYLSAPGGHRIGICGEVIQKPEGITGFRRVVSLSIRVARDMTGIAEGLPEDGSVLILGAPGWGKTTLLRDLVRRRSWNQKVAVVDGREELFPPDFTQGRRMDLLTGAPKGRGIDMVLRSMGPAYIAVDEITCEEDCDAVIRAYGCGVGLLATAHAACREDLNRRPIYRRLVQAGVFSAYVFLKQDRSFTLERSEGWKCGTSEHC